MHKKIISLFAALIMLFTVSGETVFAASNLEATQIFDVTEQDGKIIYEWNEPERLMPDTEAGSKTQTSATLPSAYSLVSTLPSVREQEYGTCWAYAALASLESNLIKKGLADSSVDLSENHLAWFTYNGSNSSTKSAYAGQDTFLSSDPYSIGGNSYFATATLARWYGAASESTAPEAVPLKKSLQTRSEVQLGNVDFLPDPTTDSTRNTLKKYIMNSGAVTISYYHDEDYFTVKNGVTTYYYSGSEYPNHDVTIVGWDDSISTRAGSKGAWLIRNSYGSNWGDDGYFYLSYYDASLCEPTGVTAGSAAKTYDRIYQYDGTGYGDNLFGYSERAMAANVYTARADERVRAVGTYTIDAGSSITVRMYLNPSSSSPASGTKLYEKTFTASYAGYHILNLGKDINIPSGCKFSVIIETYSDMYLIPVEIQANNAVSYVSLDYSKGQSYVYADGEWADTTEWGTINRFYDMGNALAKAYTYSAGTAAQTLSGKNSYTKTYGCGAFYLDTKVTFGTEKLYYTSSNTSVATVSSSGKVTVKKPGKVTITVIAAPNATYKSATKKITLTVKPKKSTVTKLSSSSKGKLQVKWKKDSTATGYQIVIAKNKKFTKGKKTAYIKSKRTVSKTFTKLSSKKKYYVKVRAYKIVSGKKIYGPYSSVKAKTVK